MDQNEDPHRFEQIFNLIQENGTASKESLEVLCKSIGLDLSLLQDVTSVDLQGFANLFGTFSLHQPRYDDEFRILATDGKVEIGTVVEAITRVGDVERQKIVQMLGHLKIDLGQVEYAKFIREELKK